MHDRRREILGYAAVGAAVFAYLPQNVHEQLARLGWRYYTFIGQGAARFMCSWATADADVDALLTDVRSAAAAASHVA